MYIVAWGCFSQHERRCKQNTCSRLAIISLACVLCCPHISFKALLSQPEQSCRKPMHNCSRCAQSHPRLVPFIHRVWAPVQIALYVKPQVQSYNRCDPWFDNCDSNLAFDMSSRAMFNSWRIRCYINRYRCSTEYNPQWLNSVYVDEDCN